MRRILVIKKSPVFIVISFVGLQLVSIFLYQAASSLADYGEIWESLPILNHFPYILAQGLAILLTEVALISYPFLSWYRKAPELDDNSKPLELIKILEHERLERKSTFRWDLKTRAVNRALEKAAMKTVAAFMNSQGGHLLLGVGDNGEAVGLEHDYITLSRRDADGLQNHFSNLLSSMLGPSFRQHVRMKPFTHEGKECMLVSVTQAERPAYLRDQDHEEFFIRTGNGTTALRMSEAHAYIATRFSTK